MALKFIYKCEFLKAIMAEVFARVSQHRASCHDSLPKSTTGTVKLQWYHLHQNLESCKIRRVWIRLVRFRWPFPQGDPHTTTIDVKEESLRVAAHCHEVASHVDDTADSAPLVPP